MKKNRPRIGLCAAYRQGLEITEFMFDFGYPIELVVTYESDLTKFEKKIAKKANQQSLALLRHRSANSEMVRNKIMEMKLDIIILAWWPEIVKADSIEAASVGWINLHPSYLPYNRGKHPYYWSVVEGTPFGATVHLIDKGVDTGKILFQKKIPVGFSDTGESLYNKGVKTCLDLFKKNYKKITKLEFKPKRQLDTKATYHKTTDLDQHSTIDLEKTYQAKDLINRLRARTFPGAPSAWCVYQGKKYYLRLEIEAVDNK